MMLRNKKRHPAKPEYIRKQETKPLEFKPGDKLLFLLRKAQALKLKTKIRLTLAVLFAAITLLGIMGSYYIQKTSNNTILMLRDNYTTIDYATKMSQSVNDMIGTVSMRGTSESYKRQELRKSFSNFERYLYLMLEKGVFDEEQEITVRIQEDYTIFKENIWKLISSERVPIDIYMQRLHLLNLLESMQEINARIIQQRTEEASDIADQVTIYMIVLGLFFFLFASLSLFYFPNYIANPIQRLTESIKQIAKKNYSQRLEVEHEDELGEMSRSFNLMAEKLSEYENINVSQILSEKRRTESIVNRMNEAIIGLDDKKNILFANPPVLNLVNLKRRELIGKNAAILAKQNPLFQHLVKEALADDVPDNMTYPVISVDKDNNRYYFSKDVLRVESSNKEGELPMSVGYVIILKNVTELKEQDIAKTNFMATLSHELKTPISAIDMSLNLLKDPRVGLLNEEQTELAGTISSNSARLLKMVNEILDISTIESGKLQLNMEATEPESVVYTALENVQPFILEKQIQISKTLSSGLPKLSIDKQKICAVLINFLTNAVRYSHAGDEVSISLQLKEERVQFCVKDNGPGIPEEEQKKLFQPYSRTAGDKTKGTGLGLAISKEFVEAHGGSIWVESKPGKGSIFGFELPVRD
jgi:signal transduction histidine kinase/HAMP domain-containing protein